MKKIKIEFEASEEYMDIGGSCDICDKEIEHGEIHYRVKNQKLDFFPQVCKGCASQSD